MASVLESLENRGRVRLFGPKTRDSNDRVPTFGFVPVPSGPGTEKRKTPSVADAVETCRGERHKVAIRSGSMYAVRLCEDLGLDPNEGVIRCSLAHYNTVDEVARLEKALEEAFR